ncbi:MAG TPA: sulfite exporter TauE/SafE family protein [Candidatus Eremiobacteraceae bacterium]|nr:sulfite exporter TauE/SafE family protein [Candidatus Eremiobacteraceae bacterium]
MRQDGIVAAAAKGGAMATWLVLFAAAVFGGALNAVAGGGSFLTFPALLFVGVPPVSANTTSTAALLPGVFASITGYREDFPKASTFVLCLSAASLIGGVAGAIFLLRTPEDAFRRLIPYLLGIATLTFMLSKRLSSWLGREEHQVAAPSVRALALVSAVQLTISIYGGYFGGGIGILMLATLGLMGMRNINEMNAVKTLLAAIINTVAFVTFVFARNIVWPYAVVMLLGSVLGGYVGARYVRRFDQSLVRGFIALVGIVMTAFFFIRQGL